jgi:hypothetical protein
MKLSLRYIQAAVVALALAIGASAYAESPREEVAHAHRLLKFANGDYAGHRANALRELQEAGKSLHLELGGEVDKHEKQWKSDQQLEEARRLLREAKDKLEREDRDRVAARLDKAIEEIDHALKVR